MRKFPFIAALLKLVKTSTGGNHIYGFVALANLVIGNEICLCTCFIPLYLNQNIANRMLRAILTSTKE